MKHGLCCAAFCAAVLASPLAAQMPWGDDPNDDFVDETGQTPAPAPNPGANPVGAGQNPFGSGMNPFGGQNAGAPAALTGGAGKYQLGGVYAVVNPTKEGQGLPAGAWGLSVLEVEAGGAGARAGLAPGDLILGVGGQAIPEKEHPVDYLERLIIGLEEQKKGGTLELRVQRASGGQTVKVAIEPQGRGAARRRRAGLLGLQYLAETQNGDGSWNVELRNHNSMVTVAALGGLALLAGGSTPAAGPHAAPLKKSLDYVLRAAGHEPSGFGGMGSAGGANSNQENWSIAYAVIFLGEVYAVHPDPQIKTKVAELVKFLAGNQEKDGSWAHGPGGPNALGYTTVQACGNLCLMAYGQAQRMSLTPDQESLKKGLAYLPETSFGDGGVGYSHNPGQKGSTADSGRTASAVVAYHLLNLRADPWYEKMVGFYRRTLVEGNRALPEGHVSSTMHVLSGALCAWGLGGGDWDEYLKHYEPLVLANRRLNGSFAMRPNHETAQGSGDTDLRMGPAWTTAQNAMILLLEDRRLPHLGGGKAKKGAAPVAKPVKTGR